MTKTPEHKHILLRVVGNEFYLAGKGRYTAKKALAYRYSSRGARNASTRLAASGVTLVWVTV